MRDKIGALLGIKSEEESLVSMLLTQSVFLGIFIGAFDISAHSLLLSAFNEKMMARGYVVSGLAGILLTFLYSKFRTRIRIKFFLILNLLFISLLTLSLWLVLIFSQANWIIFMVFIMFGPLNILALLGFHGITGMLFNREQGKRLNQVADNGLLFGAIIISFIIPILLSFKFQLQDILLISASSVFSATILQISLGNKFGHLVSNKPLLQNRNENEGSLIIGLSENREIKTLVIFSLLSVLTAFFIQYIFMALTREQYPEAENMARFLGFFTGGVMIIVLIIKLGVFKYILYNYGLRICLIIAPVLIGAITLAAVTLGSIFGYSPAAFGGFVLFFILLAISRLISKSLKDSLESPSVSVIYQSIFKKSDTEIQTGKLSFYNEIAVIFSGLVLVALGLFDFIKHIHFELFLLFISLGWLYTASRLFKRYRESIINESEESGFGRQEVIHSDYPETFQGKFSGYLAFRKDYYSLVSGDFSAMDKNNNKWYFEKIVEYADSKKDINLIPVLKKITNNTSLEESVRQHSSNILEFLQGDSGSIRYSDEKIGVAIKTLYGTRKPQTTEIFRLLKENSVESKRLAIYMIGKFKLSDLLSEVCICLSIPDLTIDASEVLKSFGSGADNELLRYFISTSGNLQLSRTILRLLGKTCTKETTGFLFSRLWSNSRQLKEISVKCLINCNFSPSDEEKQRLNQLISEVIGIITLHLSSKISFERENNTFLLNKINHEIDRWQKFLINLLSLNYNPGSIAVIHEKINNGSLESVSYALELTDIVISGSIKQKLISLFDGVPDEVKLKNLFQFFPGAIPLHKKLLEDLINCDYNLISLWTKACTLRSIPKIEGDDMAESVTALLFSPEELIQEEAANLISRSDSGLYLSASQRIPLTVKNRLDEILNGTTDKKELIFEKVQFLSTKFSGIEEDDLLLFASEMKYKNESNIESLDLTYGLIIWLLTEDNEKDSVHILFDGETDRLAGLYQSPQNISVYYLPLSAVEQYHFQFPDKSSEILKYIDSHEE